MYGVSETELFTANSNKSTAEMLRSSKLVRLIAGLLRNPRSPRWRQAPTMKKLLTLFVLIVIAIFTAGVYGIVHDQISYTVSPEYFTKFKFEQFGLVDSPLPDRVKAGIVGFLAS